MGVDDLIAALASPPGSGAIGIVRISGRSLRSLVERCFLPDDPPGWLRCRSPRRFTGRWQIAATSAPCALMFWPCSRSYTGQPTAELHLPGSPPLLECALAELYQRGVRPAGPGEFTLRAFLAGKIDLVQAEAVLGVIDAHDDAELKTALEQLAGGISSRLSQLRGDLLDLLSDLEAGLDFVEEDIEFVSRAELVERITAARVFVNSLLMQSWGRMTSDPLPKVVLAGLPNAGKSTLFNRLASQPLAITSPEQGTTRDYLQSAMTAAGMTWMLVDTAGWEASVGGIAQAAQDQRDDQFRRAALVVWCTAADLGNEDRQRDVAAFRSVAATMPTLHVQTKCEMQKDLPSGGREPPVTTSPRGGHIQGAYAPRSEIIESAPAIKVSAAVNLGIDELKRHIAAILKGPATKTSSWLGMTAARCRDSLEQAAAALERAETAAAEVGIGDELLAVDLRAALDHLGEVVGAVYTDDLLDRIFSKFCIGK